MFLIALAFVNGAFAAGIVAALAYACRMPYRFDRL
jgi:hypothetical protein